MLSPKKSLIRFGCVLLILLCDFTLTFSRETVQALDSDSVWYALCATTHTVGAYDFIVTNRGVFGYNGGIKTDCFTGDYFTTPTGYPRGTKHMYVPFGYFWVGAIAGRDTLVSTGGNFEMWPDIPPFGEMKRRSIRDRSKPEFIGAISEEDIVATYSDTVVMDYSFSTDPIEHRLHKPLDIEIHQESYAWSFGYADDFVLFSCRFKNIGTRQLWGVYLGLDIDPFVVQEFMEDEQRAYTSQFDDICGFLSSHPTSYGGCDWVDTVNLAWYADNDGDFLVTDPQLEPMPHVGGVRVLNLAGDSLTFSYNWWSNGYWWDLEPDLAYNWGPQTRDKYRDFVIGGQGYPEGDRNKYHIMRNGEFDYDQIYTQSMSTFDPVWMPPPSSTVGADIGNGLEVEYLLSCGPYMLDPGESLPLVFAVVLGKNFHKDPLNYQHNMIETYNPDRFYENVDFSDIVTNAQWASWVYDNPGVDTDSDGYAGKFRMCCTDSTIQSIDSTVTPWDTLWAQGECEKVYYEGDGVPDYRGAAPPPAPKFWLKPEVGRITVRWNGTYSETTKDIFLQKIDFEGYRVYLSRDARETSYSLLASYDREDYDRYVWKEESRVWEVTDIPFTLDQCRCLYGTGCGDSTFDPLDYPRSHPYFMPGFPDSIFYFAPHDFNQYDLGVTTPIHKVYPNQPPPSAIIPDSADASELTDDGLFKYYEYEMTLDNILPTVAYYVNVTAFDFGSPKSKLTAMETSKTVGPQIAYPLSSANDVVAQKLKAYVYPNPYRIDGGYYDKGYEGRDAQWYIPERLRRIHFANLPPKCTISIFTLDGDLVRRLDHDKDPSDPAASHDTWDLISRNTQAVVSGIYYWTVEQPGGETQIGKLVIIK